MRSVVNLVIAVFVTLTALTASTAAQESATKGLSQKNFLSDAPSLRLHVTLKRNNSQFHGHSEFDIYANPVVSSNGTTILYDGYTKFIDDGETFTYSYVNGSGYLSVGAGDKQSVHCIPSDTFAFDSILSALNDATSIPSASVGDEIVECASGNMFRATFAREPFSICASGMSGFTLHNSDMKIEVKYLAYPVEIQKPTFRKGLLCDVKTAPIPAAPVTLALLTGTSIPASSSRHLKSATHMAMEASSCTCKSTPRPCIFLHGLGNPNERAELQDTPALTKEKFGDIAGHAPCCSSIKYAVMNTVDIGWRNDTLQQKFCDHSLSMSDTSDVSTGTIADTIIVTHSMGGLVMAGALATGKCQVASTTTWVSLSAPMTGSMAGDHIQNICKGEFSQIVSGLMTLLGQCPASIAKKSIPYQNGEYSTRAINKAYSAAQEAYRGNVSAALCSTSYHGIFSKFYPSCLVGGKFIPHKSKENDALVEFKSCLGGLDPRLFGDSYMNRFYAAELNHADTAFLTRDGFFKDSQKPFKWFECLL